MSDLTYTHQPLSDRTWLRPTDARVPARFDSTWSQTEELLARELDHLRADQVILEVDVDPSQLRKDGTLRAKAKAASPAVVLAFVSAIHGPQSHRCDRFVTRWSDRTDWQENARAIALTLEALRAMDRYGTAEGRQYTGFKALPAGTGDGPSHMTTEDAAVILGTWSGVRWETVLAVTDARKLALRRARAATHPDTHPDLAEGWDDVRRAAAAFGLA